MRKDGRSKRCWIVDYSFSGGFVQVSDATQELLDALQQAASSLIEDNVSLVKLGSKTNPGVPPSSFMSFLNEVILQLKYITC